MSCILWMSPNKSKLILNAKSQPKISHFAISGKLCLSKTELSLQKPNYDLFYIKKAL